ncbi:MAG: hypothetical protein ACKVZH_16815 [Blastocatellia bacterium]
MAGAMVAAYIGVPVIALVAPQTGAGATVGAASTVAKQILVKTLIAAAVATAIKTFVSPVPAEPDEDDDDDDDDEEILIRYASGPESANRLERLSEESLANPGELVHGVSTTAGPPTRSDFRALPRKVVEKAFPVHNTPGRDKRHRTVELPHPVSQADAKRWNDLWGFKK